MFFLYYYLPTFIFIYKCLYLYLYLEIVSIISSRIGSLNVQEKDNKNILYSYIFIFYRLNQIVKGKLLLKIQVIIIRFIIIV